MILDLTIEEGTEPSLKKASNLKALVEKQKDKLTDREIRHAEAAISLAEKCIFVISV